MDIRLINILPTPGVQQSGQVSLGSSSGAPGLYIQFPPGSILSGFIVNRDPQGNPILRTETGDLTFQSNLFLKIGTEVQIRIESRGGNLLAHILNINGEPPEQYATQQNVSADDAVVVLPKFAQPEGEAPPTSLAPPSARVAAPEPAAVIRNAPSTVVSGALLTPAANAEPDAPEPPLVFRITNLQTPQAATQQPAFVAYARSTGAPVPLVPAPTTSAPAAPQPLNIGQTFTAPVIAVEPTGEPLIQTPAGIVRLQNTQLPQGAQVTLEVLPPTTQLSAPQPLPPAPLPELAKQWTSLAQISSLLTSHNAPMPAWFAPLAPSATTPPASQQITGGLMVFVAALRGGDFQNWLGDDSVQWLKQNGHEPLVKKAEAEFATLVRAFTEPSLQTNQWQPLFFPVAVDGQWQQVRMFLKRDRRQNKKTEGHRDDDTRFIVEMTLSQLGELQLDGLVHRSDKQVEFDLFIRSLSPLEAAIQNDILRIYSDIGGITGYKGQLVFQAVREFPVNPMKEALAQSGGVVA